MAQIQWAQALSGRFSVSTNWTGGVVPGEFDAAILDTAGGAAYTVTTEPSEVIEVGSLATAANATLEIIACEFLTVSYALDCSNVGTITISGASGHDNTLWETDGSIDNIGRVNIASGETGAYWVVGRTGTLSGGGTISISDAAKSGVEIEGQMINEDNRIIGGGTIFGPMSGPYNPGLLTNETSGLINATGKVTALTISIRELVNTGLVESTGSAGMSITAVHVANRQGGTIVEKGTGAVVIDTGAGAISNAELIEAAGSGGLTIQSPVSNTGRLEANGGTLTVNGAVTGGGLGVIAGGLLDFTSSFNERVHFLQGTGELRLAQSQAYTNSVFGFSEAGGTSLDLRDIGFQGPGEATYSGTGHGGLLTVSDGAHTARIRLKGDFLSAQFIASSDGTGGTMIVAQAASGASAFVQSAAAMASLGDASTLLGSPTLAQASQPTPSLVSSGP